MKPYGIPRVPEIECPDLVDLHIFALKASKGNIKNTFKSSISKRATRRIWKKKARINNKKLCKVDI
jgi:hypothetical protein